MAQILSPQILIMVMFNFTGLYLSSCGESMRFQKNLFILHLSNVYIQTKQTILHVVSNYKSAVLPPLMSLLSTQQSCNQL